MSRPHFQNSLYPKTVILQKKKTLYKIQKMYVFLSLFDFDFDIIFLLIRKNTEKNTPILVYLQNKKNMLE